MIQIITDDPWLFHGGIIASAHLYQEISQTSVG